MLRTRIKPDRDECSLLISECLQATDDATRITSLRAINDFVQRHGAASLPLLCEGKIFQALTNISIDSVGGSEETFLEIFGVVLRMLEIPGVFAGQVRTSMYQAGLLSTLKDIDGFGLSDHVVEKANAIVLKLQVPISAAASEMQMRSDLDQAQPSMYQPSVVSQPQTAPATLPTPAPAPQGGGEESQYRIASTYDACEPSMYRPQQSRLHPPPLPESSGPDSDSASRTGSPVAPAPPAVPLVTLDTADADSTEPPMEEGQTASPGGDVNASEEREVPSSLGGLESQPAAQGSSPSAPDTATATPETDVLQPPAKASNGAGVVVPQDEPEDMSIDVSVDDMTESDLGSLFEKAKASFDAGRLSSAEVKHSVCLRGRRAKLGDTHFDTFESIYELARVKNSLGKYEEALELLKERMKLKARDDIEMSRMSSIFLIGIVNHNLSRFSDAIRMHKDCLKMRESRLGVEHPDALSSQFHLAKAYDKSGDAVSAENLFQSCLKQQTKVLGEDHVDVLLTKHTFGLFCATHGKPALAVHLLSSCLTSRTKDGANAAVIEETARDLGTARESLDSETAALLSHDGFGQAHARALHTAWKARCDHLGHIHPSGLSVLRALVKLHKQNSDVGSAVEVMSESVAARKEITLSGEQTSELLDDMTTLASLYTSRKDTSRAISILSDILKKQEEIYQDTDPRLIRTLHEIASAYLEAGDATSAATKAADCVKRLELSSGSDADATLEAMLLHARAMYRMGEFADVVEMLEVCVGRHRKNTIRTRQAVGRSESSATAGPGNRTGSQIYAEAYADSLRLLADVYEGPFSGHESRVVPLRKQVLWVSMAVKGNKFVQEARHGLKLSIQNRMQQLDQKAEKVLQAAELVSADPDVSLSSVTELMADYNSLFDVEDEHSSAESVPEKASMLFFPPSDGDLAKRHGILFREVAEFNPRDELPATKCLSRLGILSYICDRYNEAEETLSACLELGPNVATAEVVLHLAKAKKALGKPEDVCSLGQRWATMVHDQILDADKLAELLQIAKTATSIQNYSCVTEMVGPVIHSNTRSIVPTVYLANGIEYIYALESLKEVSQASVMFSRFLCLTCSDRDLAETRAELHYHEAMFWQRQGDFDKMKQSLNAGNDCLKERKKKVSAASTTLAPTMLASQPRSSSVAGRLDDDAFGSTDFIRKLQAATADLAGQLRSACVQKFTDAMTAYEKQEYESAFKAFYIAYLLQKDEYGVYHHDTARSLHYAACSAWKSYSAITLNMSDSHDPLSGGFEACDPPGERLLNEHVTPKGIKTLFEFCIDVREALDGPDNPDAIETKYQFALMKFELFRPVRRSWLGVAPLAKSLLHFYRQGGNDTLYGSPSNTEEVDRRIGTLFNILFELTHESKKSVSETYAIACSRLSTWLAISRRVVGTPNVTVVGEAGDTVLATPNKTPAGIPGPSSCSSNGAEAESSIPEPDVVNADGENDFSLVSNTVTSVISSKANNVQVYVGTGETSNDDETNVNIGRNSVRSGIPVPSGKEVHVIEDEHNVDTMIQNSSGGAIGSKGDMNDSVVPVPPPIESKRPESSSRPAGGRRRRSMRKSIASLDAAGIATRESDQGGGAEAEDGSDEGGYSSFSCSEVDTVTDVVPDGPEADTNPCTTSPKGDTTSNASPVVTKGSMEISTAGLEPSTTMVVTSVSKLTKREDPVDTSLHMREASEGVATKSAATAHGTEINADHSTANPVEEHSAPSSKIQEASSKDRRDSDESSPDRIVGTTSVSSSMIERVEPKENSCLGPDTAPAEGSGTLVLHNSMVLPVPAKPGPIREDPALQQLADALKSYVALFGCDKENRLIADSIAVLRAYMEEHPLKEGLGAIPQRAALREGLNAHALLVQYHRAIAYFDDRYYKHLRTRARQLLSECNLIRYIDATCTLCEAGKATKEDLRLLAVVYERTGAYQKSCDTLHAYFRCNSDEFLGVAISAVTISEFEESLPRSLDESDTELIVCVACVLFHLGRKEASTLYLQKYVAAFSYSKLMSPLYLKALWYLFHVAVKGFADLFSKMPFLRLLLQIQKGSLHAAPGLDSTSSLPVFSGDENNMMSYFGAMLQDYLLEVFQKDLHSATAERICAEAKFDRSPDSVKDNPPFDLLRVRKKELMLLRLVMPVGATTQIIRGFTEIERDLHSCMEAAELLRTCPDRQQDRMRLAEHVLQVWREWTSMDKFLFSSFLEECNVSSECVSTMLSSKSHPLRFDVCDDKTADMLELAFFRGMPEKAFRGYQTLQCAWAQYEIDMCETMLQVKPGTGSNGNHPGLPEHLRNLSLASFPMRRGPISTYFPNVENQLKFQLNASDIDARTFFGYWMTMETTLVAENMMDLIAKWFDVNSNSTLNFSANDVQEHLSTFYKSLLSVSARRQCCLRYLPKLANLVSAFDVTSKAMPKVLDELWQHDHVKPLMLSHVTTLLSRAMDDNQVFEAAEYLSLVSHMADGVDGLPESEREKFRETTKSVFSAVDKLRKPIIARLRDITSSTNSSNSFDAYYGELMRYDLRHVADSHFVHESMNEAVKTLIENRDFLRAMNVVKSSLTARPTLSKKAEDSFAVCLGEIQSKLCDDFKSATSLKDHIGILRARRMTIGIHHPETLESLLQVGTLFLNASEKEKDSYTINNAELCLGVYCLTWYIRLVEQAVDLGTQCDVLQKLYQKHHGDHYWPASVYTSTTKSGDIVLFSNRTYYLPKAVTMDNAVRRSILRAKCQLAVSQIRRNMFTNGLKALLSCAQEQTQLFGDNDPDVAVTNRAIDEAKKSLSGVSESHACSVSTESLVLLTQWNQIMLGDSALNLKMRLQYVVALYYWNREEFGAALPLLRNCVKNIGVFSFSDSHAMTPFEIQSKYAECLCKTLHAEEALQAYRDYWDLLHSERSHSNLAIERDRTRKYIHFLHAYLELTSENQQNSQCRVM